MKIIRLSVPFHQKEQAKTLGARWNNKGKFWYITHDEERSLFAQWMQNENEKLNISSTSYFIAKSFRTCWKCKQFSDVYAIILPKPNPFSKEYARILYYLTNISQEVQERFYDITSYYYYDYSNMTHSSYWMNHCQHCNARFGDFETIEEYTSSFKPRSIADAKKVVLFLVEEKLEAAGIQSKEVAFLAQMEIRPIPSIHV